MGFAKLTTYLGLVFGSDVYFKLPRENDAINYRFEKMGAFQ